MQQPTFWNIRQDFLKASPEDVLNGVIGDDRNNYDTATEAHKDYLEIVDNLLVFYISVLQEFFRNLERWQNDDKIRSAVEMLSSAFNFLLLARHAVLLGYYPEVQGILRDAHERYTRVPVFLLTPNMAKQFLAGKEIKQAEIDRALAKVLEKDDAQVLQVQKRLREHYGYQSTEVHPNLTSSSTLLRHPSVKLSSQMDEEARRVVGRDATVGGLMGPQVGHLVLMSLSSSLMIASIVSFRALEASGIADSPKHLRSYQETIDRLQKQVVENAPSSAT